MPLLASILAGIIPMLTYLLIIWKMDKYEPEPLKLIAANFLWGAIGAVILSIAGSYFFVLFLQIFSIYESSMVHSVIIAPVVEEIAKALFLLYIISKRDFDNITDGLVYGAAIGLGFGMSENIFYFITYGTTVENWIFLVAVRSTFSAVMHGLATAVVGAFFGMAKYSNLKFRYILPPGGLAIASFIHFMWNYSVSFENTFYWGFAFIVVAAISFILIFGMSLKTERKIIKSELKGEIPDNHITILLSKLKKEPGWVDEVEQKNYIKSAINLAFRKRQLQQKIKQSKTLIEDDIKKLREYLSSVNITNEEE